MKVFLIGGTGFIGRSVAERLVEMGHKVVGLARSEKSASALAAAGIEPCLVPGGLLGDAATLVAAAAGCEAVIDTATHNFRDSIPGIKAVRTALGRDGILISTTGLNFYGDVPGSKVTPVSEDKATFGWKPRVPEFWSKDLKHMMEKIEVWWPEFENAVLKDGEGAVKTCIIRPGLVYGRGNGGLGGGVLGMMKHAAASGNVAFVNDGRGGLRSCVQVDDLADLYLVVLENLASGLLPGKSVVNASSCTVTPRALADALSVACGNLPVSEISFAEAVKTVGVMAAEETTVVFVPDTSRGRSLGWNPKRASLIDDLTTGSYVGIAERLRHSVTPGVQSKL